MAKVYEELALVCPYDREMRAPFQDLACIDACIDELELNLRVPQRQHVGNET